MFQVSSVLKDAWNEYDKNDYAQTSDSNLDGSGSYQIKQSILQVLDSDSYVLLIGDSENDETGKMAKLWCEYQKIDCFSYQSLSNIPKKILEGASFLLIDSDFLDVENDIPVLETLLEEGISMIFCNLPDVKIVENSEALRKLLGIYSIKQESVELEGIELFEDFLLGGRTIYQATTEEEEKQQDLALNLPWYTTYSGVKRYMVGLIDIDKYSTEQQIKNEDLPTIIWRNSLENAKVFAVNGDYMEDVTALGIYSAMLYEMNDYVLYPVVNAQNFSVVNFAAFSSEEDEMMMDIYSRKQKVFFQDLVWPTLTAVYEKSKDVPTFFITSKLDYTTDEVPDGKKLISFQKLFKEFRAESGWSLHQLSSVSLEQKLKVDREFFNENIEGYQFTSLFVENDQWMSLLDELEDIRIVCMPEDTTKAPVSYASDEITKQYVTHNGFEHTYSDNLRLKSLETSLGYSNILLDMEDILVPKTSEDTWEKKEERFASYTITYWKPFQAFEKTAISQSDARIRQFLNLNYEESKNDNEITLKIDSLEEEAYFILRLHGQKIESIEGGTYTAIEDNAYLISTQQENVKITVEDKTSLYYTYK
jgi:hypothetical protein